MIAINNNGDISLAAYLSQLIDSSTKKQYEIARECGFDQPNIITMIKQGKTRLPRDKVFNMARALEIDGMDLLKRMYLEYYPDEWVMIERLINQPVLTDAEIKAIGVLREGSSGMTLTASKQSEYEAMIDASDTPKSIVELALQAQADRYFNQGDKKTMRTLSRHRKLIAELILDQATLIRHAYARS